LPRAAQRRKSQDPAAVLAQIESFLESCREPVVAESGERPLALEPNQYALTGSASGCLLEVWGAEGSLVRRISRITTERSDRLEVQARQFGGATLTLVFYDRARSTTAAKLAAERRAFSGTFRRLLQRNFPDATTSTMTAAADLPRSLSPLYTRGTMTEHGRTWAVIAASEDVSADGLLTFGLIWLSVVRDQESRRVAAGLRMFVPRGRESRIAARLPWLTRELRFELWSYDSRGEMYPVEPETAGNMRTAPARCYAPPRPTGKTAERLKELLSRTYVEATPLPEGMLSLRVSGIEFAQAAGTVMTFGLESRTTVDEINFQEVLRLAEELARFRRADPADRLNPLYTRYPERWLESQFRQNPQAVDVTLERYPIYSHVSTLAGLDRGILDLLAVDLDRRLAVVELKTSEDIHLPLQGLDYWLRVRLMLERGELAEAGYFPGQYLSPEAPRLLLVSPALDFHPMTETVLSFISEEVPVERIGVGADWRRVLEMRFRLHGAERP